MSLNIPIYKNLNESDCFVSATAMVLDFYGVKINRKKVFRDAEVFIEGESFGCTVPSIILALEDTGYKMRAWYFMNFDEISNENKSIRDFFEDWYLQEKFAINKKILEKFETNDLSLINKYLLSNIPVIIGIHSATFYKGNRYWENSSYINESYVEKINHVLVLTGYKNGFYTYNDSSPFLPKRESKDRTVSEKLLKKAWKNAAYVKNGFFILEKNI